MEEWAPIPEWPHYQASTEGRLRRNGRLLKQRIRHRGWLEVKLSHEGKSRTCLVHQLIARTFLGSSPGKQINHLDGNKQNNTIRNLQWASDAENKRHAVLLGLYQRGEKRYNAKLSNGDIVEIKELAHGGMPHLRIAKKFGVSQPLITRILSGKIWKHMNG